MKRVCRRCGKKFEAERASIRYCPKCTEERAAERSPEARMKRMQESSRAIDDDVLRAFHIRNLSNLVLHKMCDACGKCSECHPCDAYDAKDFFSCRMAATASVMVRMTLEGCLTPPPLRFPLHDTSRKDQ